MGAAAKFEFETTFINSVIGAGAYGLTVTITASRGMRQAGVDLCDVNHVLLTGKVVRSDMLESRGLWDVRGWTVEGIYLELTVAVISSEYDVELLEVVIVKKRGAR